MSKVWEIVKDREPWRAAVHEVANELDTTWCVNTTTIKGEAGWEKSGLLFHERP